MDTVLEEERCRICVRAEHIANRSGQSLTSQLIARCIEERLELVFPTDLPMLRRFVPEPCRLLLFKLGPHIEVCCVQSQVPDIKSPYRQRS